MCNMLIVGLLIVDLQMCGVLIVGRLREIKSSLQEGCLLYPNPCGEPFSFFVFS